MAIDRPNVFSNVNRIKFKSYVSIVDGALTFSNFRFMRIVCQTNSIVVNSVGSDTLFEQIFLNSAGREADFVFEITAPENGVISDITIDSTSTSNATAMIYYIPA